MKRLCSFLSFILILVGCGGPSAKLNRFFEKSFEAYKERHPQFQTYIGLKTNYDKLDDNTDEKSLKEIEIAKEELKKLLTFPVEKFSGAELDSYLIYKLSLEDKIAMEPFVYHDYPINQMFGEHADLPSFLINIHQVESEDDAHAYVKRLAGIATNLKNVLVKLEVRKQKKILAPKFVYSMAISDCQNLISGQPLSKGKTNTFYEDLEAKLVKLNITQEKRIKIMQDLFNTLNGQVKPVYLQLISKLKELEKVAPVDIGVWKLPDGEKYYNQLLKIYTTTNMTAEEIHQLGLKEMERIHQEMSELKKVLGFEKMTLKDFFKRVRTTDMFKYPNTDQGREQALKDSERYIADLKKRLPEMIGLKPKADIIVKRVEPYREASAGFAFYEGPSQDGKRPGIFYINLFNMTQVMKSEIEALAYHEGIPGHHMQITLAQELEGLPEFRKHSDFTAFIEGWGLYAEWLPKSLGFYQDPINDFGRLSMELWRAARLVTDTGIHSKRWSLDKAVKYLDDNTPSPHGENINAIKRYAVLPGQATAYKIGMLKIQELKKLAETELGAKFKLTEFHDQVIKDGAMPLDLLDSKIKAWIKTK
ncbi:MAG: DUF885 domain-containing protein [Bacteriovoracaceae bacterium]|nr:DUF885 domain-containing protein [Bacteriovoracaceae bacterium]